MKSKYNGITLLILLKNFPFML